MNVVRLIARLFGVAKRPEPAAPPAPPKQVELHKLSFRPTPGNGTRVFRSRSVRGNAA
jgi:hypothetical protein